MFVAVIVRRRHCSSLSLFVIVVVRRRCLLSLSLFDIVVVVSVVVVRRRH
jgi:hypothetical protein